MALTRELAKPPRPEETLKHLISQYTKDALLQCSLFNMVTLRHKFDHFQYVTCVSCDGNMLLEHPHIVAALAYCSKIRFALPNLPRFYKDLWEQLVPVIQAWQHRLNTMCDSGFAELILEMQE